MRWFVTLVLLACTSDPLAAQVGQLDERTQYAVLTGPGMDNAHGTLQAIVLWRGSPGWDQLRGAARTRADSAFRWSRLRADERGGFVFGTSAAFGTLSRDADTLAIGAHTYAVGRRDSALVVMVAVQGEAEDWVVTAVRVRRDLLPEEYWTRIWHSGDTTFIVQPRTPRSHEMLRAALHSVPEVAAFLR
jgi:hypothetical protein